MVFSAAVSAGTLWLAFAVSSTRAQDPAPAVGKGIYTCIDATGKRLTSDRPIPQCIGRDQRLLNSDGSLRQTLPPTMTADERAEQEAREKEEALVRANRQEAVRRDRNLLQRFPNEAAHNKAREAALEEIRKGLRVSEARLAILTKERKPLLDEAEFYVGKSLPPLLKQQLDGNEATTEAQRTLVLNQQAELGRVSSLYDVEFERLKKLWGGAQPGSLGVLPRPAQPAASAVRKPQP
jgi:hypothetical protein